ncbi:MAG: hypothetical protein SGI72_05935 [Planctomycetota bacterium]|nr:hypothetical protein [Planctomycetota bacterium]
MSETFAPTVVEPKELTVEEALASLDRAMRNRPIGEGSDAEFELEYRGVSLQAARAAMLLLNERTEKERASIIEQRMSQGQFKERRADDGQGLETVSGRGAGASTMSVTQEIGADGALVSRITSFHSQDYPSLHAAQLELEYLKGIMRVPREPVYAPPGASFGQR